MAQSADLMFPNATYVISAAEWQFWMDPNYRTTMPDVLHELARGAQRDLSAVKDRGAAARRLTQEPCRRSTPLPLG
jgi:hypothetical protein